MTRRQLLTRERRIGGRWGADELSATGDGGKTDLLPPDYFYIMKAGSSLEFVKLPIAESKRCALFISFFFLKSSNRF